MLGRLGGFLVNDVGSGVVNDIAVAHSDNAAGVFLGQFGVVGNHYNKAVL